MMKFKTTWLLAGFLIVLGVYVYVVEVQGAKKQAIQKEKEEKVLVFEKDQVEAIGLKSSKGKFSAKRSGTDQWTLEEPLKVSADKFAWNSFIDTLSDLKYSRVISEKADDLVPFGLKDPKVVVELSLKGGRKQIFQLGDDNPVGDSTFATHGDTKVFLVPKNSVSTFDKELKDLREKKLFTFDEKQTQEIEIQNQGKKLVLKKNADKWAITSDPKKEEADASKVTELINTLNFLDVKNFIEEDPKDLATYELKNPQVRVKVKDAKTTQLELLLGKKTAETVYVAKVSEKPVYQVGAYVLERLSTDAQKYIKKAEKKEPMPGLPAVPHERSTK